MNHCNQIDAAKLESDLKGDTDTILNDTEAIDCIIEEFHCDAERAKEILRDIKLEEVSRIFRNFVDMGLAVIVAYDEDGEPVIELTELGKKVAEQARQTNPPKD